MTSREHVAEEGALILVLGGSCSGKSALAEDLAVRAVCPGQALYYLATLQVADDPENRQRVARHRQARQGKGFQTVEVWQGLSRQMPRLSAGSVVLLDCLGNLVANALYWKDEQDHWQAGDPEEVATRLLQQLEQLQKKAALTVLVSPDVFRDGLKTTDYHACLGEVLTRQASRAQTVIEVVYGLPNWIKRSGGGTQ